VLLELSAREVALLDAFEARQAKRMRLAGGDACMLRRRR
jgi:hypothetical protein